MRSWCCSEAASIFGEKSHLEGSPRQLALKMGFKKEGGKKKNSGGGGLEAGGARIMKSAGPARRTAPAAKRSHGEDRRRVFPQLSAAALGPHR